MNLILISNSIPLGNILIQLSSIWIHLILFIHLYILLTCIFRCEYCLRNNWLSCVLTLLMYACVTCFLLLFYWALYFVCHQVLRSHSNWLRILINCKVFLFWWLLIIVLKVTFALHFHHGIRIELVSIQERHFWGVNSLFV